MPVGYHHLTLEDRCTIEGLLRSGWSIRRIAKELQRSPGTISRELARNGKGRKGYRAAKAQEKARGRRQQASEIPRKLTAKLWAVIREKLLLQWSPEQIAGWLGQQPALPKLGWRRVYDLMWRDRQEDGYLYMCLWRAGRKRRKRTLLWWRPRAVWGTGRRTRSWVPSTKERWCPWWSASRISC